MLLVDSSSWIHFLRPNGDPLVRARVEAALTSGDACWCPLVRLELWNGAAGDRDRRILRDFETVLPELVTAGLMGLEVLHPNHSPSQIRKLEEHCAELDLLKTGGSDYHGPQPDGKGNHASQLNTLAVPWGWLRELKVVSKKLS